MVLRGLAGTFAIWAVGALLLRATLAPAHQCPDYSPDELEASAQASVAWIERSLLPDGRYVYEYNAEDDSYPGGYNEVRHAGVTMSIYQYVAESGDLGPIDTADAALQRMVDISIEHDDWLAIRNPNTGTVKLGSSSLLVAGLALRRDATGDDRYDDLMRRYARFILEMQRADGSFLNYWLTSTEAPDPTVTSKYATGEAFWALALLHNLFPDEGWDEPAIAVADYLALYRDEVEDFDFPPWADQWAAYGLSEMREWPISDAQAGYARSLAERFGFLIRVESQRSDQFLLEQVHGPKTRAAGHGTWVEGLTSLYLLAEADDRLADLRPDLRERIDCGAGMLVDRQVTPAEARQYDDPSIADGAWFSKGITRMDDQQHALSGLIRAAVIARKETE
jgi:hypothetical protein